MIRALLFDVDGVLMDSKAANVEFYSSFLARHGYDNLDPAELEKGHYLSLMESIALLSRESEQRVHELWELARHLEGYRYDLVSLPEGAEAALRDLGARYRLGIVTSRIREGVEQFFAVSGWQRFFEVAVGFEDYERSKPDPQPLLVACEKLGVAPAAAVYVGDAEIDALSAAAAGCGFIAYGDAIAKASYRVQSFAEIAAAVAAIEASAKV